MSALYLILALACAWGCLRSIYKGANSDPWAVVCAVLFILTVVSIIASVKAAFSGG